MHLSCNVVRVTSLSMGAAARAWGVVNRGLISDKAGRATITSEVEPPTDLVSCATIMHLFRHLLVPWAAGPFYSSTTSRHGHLPEQLSCDRP